MTEVAEYVKSEILDYVSRGKSPVSGHGNFVKYDEEYKKFKSQYSSSSIVNLELTGSMLDSLEYKIDGNSIEFGIFESSETGKADGHNNHSGDSSLPTRRFIPKDNERFVHEIENEIDSILDGYREAGREVQERTGSFISNILRTAFNSGQDR